MVPGYGVELAIKNMEYNARDDGAKVGEESCMGRLALGVGEG